MILSNNPKDHNRYSWYENYAHSKAHVKILPKKKDQNSVTKIC
jgi:hypothetical protein